MRITADYHTQSFPARQRQPVEDNVRATLSAAA